MSGRMAFTTWWWSDVATQIILSSGDERLPYDFDKYDLTSIAEIGQLSQQTKRTDCSGLEQWTSSFTKSKKKQLSQHKLRQIHNTRTISRTSYILIDYGQERHSITFATIWVMSWIQYDRALYFIYPNQRGE